MGGVQVAYNNGEEEVFRIVCYYASLVYNRVANNVKDSYKSKQKLNNLDHSHLDHFSRSAGVCQWVSRSSRSTPLTQLVSTCC